ncbi:hypothetical protein LE610_004403 [Salmonella enterica]|nr:hypothetical protein [Salmonella enterica]
MTTTKHTDLTPALLAEKAKSKGIAILESEPCQKCREGTAIYFYARPKESGEGVRANGCLWCRHLEGNDLEAVPNSQVLTSAVMVDDNGVPIYEGRACSSCGSKVRIGVAAYGMAKGKCRACAIHQQEEQRHGKEIKRVNRAVTQKVHKFVVQSIERSGFVEVAPRSQQEFFELRELVYRCQVMNEQERALNTGIRWELGHKYPAVTHGELRGKATADNIHLVQYTKNRQQGNSLPDEWEQCQVISIEGCRAIQRSYEAAKAWKEWKHWEKNISPAEKKARTIKERQAQADHAERVKAIVGDAVRVMEFFNTDHIPTFEALQRQVEAKWDRVVMKMSRQIDAYIQSGHKQPYTVVREQRLTMEAFCGASSRLWLVVQTFQQLKDAFEILMEQKPTEKQILDMTSVRRHAVMWAMDLLDNPQVLVMGFTHPLLETLGNPLVWGTLEDEDTGKQWLCVWRYNGVDWVDMLTPFDAPADGINLDTVNPALLNKSQVLTPEPVYSFAGGWSDTAEDYIYEQRKHREARQTREQRQREQEAAQEARRGAERETLSKRIAFEKKAAVDGLEPLWWFAESEWSGVMLEDANRIIEGVLEEAHQHQAEIEQCSTLAELDHWKGQHDYRQRAMRNPSIVFEDLINPF